MKTYEDFSCQVIRLGAELLVSIQGDLDAYTVPLLQDNLWKHMTPQVEILTIDCAWVQYVDSAFLQFLTRMSTQVKSIHIINASRTIRKIFLITGLDDMFIYDA
ncbi:MAG TPA: STAS domain-containing protein [Candidatus Aquicultor sp.]